MNTKQVIAAVRSEAEFQAALQAAPEIIFLLESDLLTVDDAAQRAAAHHKKLYLHTDFTKGLMADKSGLAFLKAKGIYGIISTRAATVKAAKAAGLSTIQRFFIIDSKSMQTAVQMVHASEPDLVEVMPGLLFEAISVLKKRMHRPVIAGGLIRTRQEGAAALQSGADAVSTSQQSLWEGLV